MRLYYRFCRFVCQMVFLLYFRGRVFGLRNVPASGGVLLVCNHQSYLDPVVATLALHREGHYMARHTLFEHRLFSRLIRSLNAYPLRRDSADVGAIKQTLRHLQAGRVVVTFPEATRTGDGSIGMLQPGVAALARRAGVPVVPVLIDGAFEAWPRWRRWPRPGRVTVVYGRAVPAGLARRLDADRYVAHLRSVLTDMQRDLHRRAHRVAARVVR